MRRTLFAMFAAVLFLTGLSVTATAQNLNCSDFQFQEDAQAVYNQDTNDPNGLDGPIGPNNDTTGTPGLACEGLPSRGTSGTDTGAVDDSSGGPDTNGDDPDAVTGLPETGVGDVSTTTGATMALFSVVSVLALIVASVVRRTESLRS